MQKYLAYLSLIIMVSCQAPTNTNQPPKTTLYDATIMVQGDPLYFQLNIIDNLNGKYAAQILNGDETIDIDSIVKTKNGYHLPMHIFDTEINAHFEGDELIGTWKKNYAEDYELEFTAKPAGSESDEKQHEVDFLGQTIKDRYKVIFDTDAEDSSFSIGEFNHSGKHVNGTFLTKTGDYRFIHGYGNNNEYSMGTFDGEHAFVFTFTINEDSSLSGSFKSGRHWHEKWVAYPNDTIKLPSANSLTYMKSNQQLQVNVKDFTGNELIIPNRDANKPCLVQIMGTWCPNCMDETQFLSEWFKTVDKDSISIYSVAFERKDDIEYAKKRVDVLSKHYDINYPIYFGGGSSKSGASIVFNQLNEVISYPTLLFVDKNGFVKHIHTGFTGPGTGFHYDRWKNQFNQLINEIMQ